MFEERRKKEMRQQLQGQERDRAMAQAEAHRKHRLRLDAIAAKEDLFGPDALSVEERALKERHAAYFALKGELR